MESPHLLLKLRELNGDLWKQKEGLHLLKSAKFGGGEEEGQVSSSSWAFVTNPPTSHPVPLHPHPTPVNHIGSPQDGSYSPRQYKKTKQNSGENGSPA